MPGIDGFEFAQTVRQLNKEIPILFMTARDDFTAKQKGFQSWYRRLHGKTGGPG